MTEFTYPDPDALVRFMGSADGFSAATIAEFEAKTERDFRTINPWLPRRISAILDIGAGLGVVNILICRARYAAPAYMEIHVLDGDGTAEKRTSFRAKMEAWADKRLARALIEANVPSGCDVFDHEPDPEATIPVDLIISLKSWGHHYPVGIYSDLAERSLRPRGRIIMDIRKGRGDGVRLMQEAGFRWLGKAHDTPKCERMVFCRASSL